MRLLPAHFLVGERHGYRFQFEGWDSEREDDEPWLVAPAFRHFTYVAVPERSLCSDKSFLLSSETMAVHIRTDGKPPTTDDPILERLDGATARRR